MRLWAVGHTTVLLDDESPTLEELGLDERQSLLVEVRNADLTWPEEIGALRFLFYLLDSILLSTQNVY